MRTELTPEEIEAAGLNVEPDRSGPGQNMTRQEIRHELYKAGFNIAGLERAAKLPTGAVNQSLIKRYPKVDRVIAVVLKRQLHEIWPERYREDGSSIRAGSPELTGVRRELAEKGFTPEQLEASHNLPKGSVRAAFHKRYPKVDAVIAEAVGRHLSDIWPDRYLTSGAPVPDLAKGRPDYIAAFNDQIESLRGIERIIIGMDGSRTTIYKAQLPPGVGSPDPNQDGRDE